MSYITRNDARVILSVLNEIRTRTLSRRNACDLADVILNRNNFAASPYTRDDAIALIERLRSRASVEAAVKRSYTDQTDQPTKIIDLYDTPLGETI